MVETAPIYVGEISFGTVIKSLSSKGITLEDNRALSKVAKLPQSEVVEMSLSESKVSSHVFDNIKHPKLVRMMERLGIYNIGEVTTPQDAFEYRRFVVSMWNGDERVYLVSLRMDGVAITYEDSVAICLYKALFD